MIYRTKDGDVLDALCRVHYGSRAGASEVVLAANPGLAALGPVHPSGILIDFPELPAAARSRRCARCACRSPSGGWAS